MLSTKKQQENSRYFSYPHDGWQDLFIGFGILLAGLFIKSEMVWMAAIFIPVFLPSWQKARNRFLDRRIGDTEFTPKQQAQSQKAVLTTMIMLGLLVFAGLAVFFIFTMTSSAVNAWMRQYFLIVLGAIFGGVWIYSAIFLKIKRFYLYGLLTFALLAASQFVNMEFWLALSILGAMITIFGTVILIRFIQDHPILED